MKLQQRFQKCLVLWYSDCPLSVFWEFNRLRKVGGVQLELPCKVFGNPCKKNVDPITIQPQGFFINSSLPFFNGKIGAEKLIQKFFEEYRMALPIFLFQKSLRNFLECLGHHASQSHRENESEKLDELLHESSKLL